MNRVLLAGLALGLIGAGLWLKPFGSPRDVSRLSESSEPSASPIQSPAGSTQSTRGAAVSSPDPLDQILKQARASLPRRNQLRQSTPEEVHGTPASVVQAGRALGQLAEHLHTHPEAVSQSLGFYLECAGDREGVSSVRALCYGNLLRHEAQMDGEQRRRFSEIPEEIQSLWSSLQD